MLFNGGFSKLCDLAVTLSLMIGQKHFNQLLAQSMGNDCPNMNEIGAKLRPVAWQQNLTTNKQTNKQTNIQTNGTDQRTWRKKNFAK